MAKDFMMREKTFGEGQITVTRTRTSSGLSLISIKKDEQSITFSNENDNRGYEIQALHLAELIEMAVKDPCLLPIAEEK